MEVQVSSIISQTALKGCINDIFIDELTMENALFARSLFDMNDMGLGVMAYWTRYGK